MTQIFDFLLLGVQSFQQLKLETALGLEFFLRIANTLLTLLDDAVELVDLELTLGNLGPRVLKFLFSILGLLIQEFSFHLALLQLVSQPFVFRLAVVQVALQQAVLVVLFLELRAEFTSALALNFELVAKAFISLLDVLELFFRELFVLRQVVDLAFQLALVFLEFLVLALDSTQLGLRRIGVTSTVLVALRIVSFNRILFLYLRVEMLAVILTFEVVLFLFGGRVSRVLAVAVLVFFFLLILLV